MVDSVDGGVIARVPTGLLREARFKRPYIVIHRVDLHSRPCSTPARPPNVRVDPGHRRGHLTRTLGRSACASTSRTAASLEGAALIGADGLRSTIRQQMLGEGEPRTIGYVAHRTIVPMQDVTSDVDRDERGAVVGRRLPHRSLSAAQQHAVQHRRRLQDARHAADR